MILQHLSGVFYHPIKEWKSIDKDASLTLNNIVVQLVLLALIPPVSLNCPS